MRIKRSRHTFVFPGMTGREMATRRGHVEMGMGRGGGGGVEEGDRSGDGEACRRWLGGDRERAKVG